MKRYKNNIPVNNQTSSKKIDTSSSQKSKESVLSPHLSPPMPIHNKNESIIGGLVSSVVQGAALGTGSQLASRGIDAILGPRKIETVTSEINNTQSCQMEYDAYINCIRNNDVEQCKNVFEMLSKCKNINI
jgi:hypothetical protein